MLKTLGLKTPISLSQTSLSKRTRIAQTNASLQIPNLAPRNPNHIICALGSHSNRIRNPVVSATRKPRRTHSRTSTRFLINLASLVLSNFKALPQPLDLVLDEIGGGDGISGGGGLGFWRGFGWGGFDGWGRRRKRKRIDLWLYGVLAAICVLGFVFESDGLWWGLGFGPLGVALVRWSEEIGSVESWVFLGFCLWSFVVGFSFRREQLRKWIGTARDSVFGNLGRRTRRRNYGRGFLGKYRN